MKKPRFRARLLAYCETGAGSLRLAVRLPERPEVRGVNLPRQLLDVSVADDFEIAERRELARVVGLQFGFGRPEARAVRVPAVVAQSRFQLLDGGRRNVDDIQPVPECLPHDADPVNRPVQEGVVVHREGIEDGTSRCGVSPVELLVDDE